MTFEDMHRSHHRMALKQPVEAVTSRPSKCHCKALYLNRFEHMSRRELVEDPHVARPPVEVQVTSDVRGERFIGLDLERHGLASTQGCGERKS